MGHQPMANTQAPPEMRRSSPDEVTFTIPKHLVGVVIGKGGQGLKDLQSEFGVRVFVEREEVNGMRLVVVKPLGGSGEPVGDNERNAMKCCQDRILSIIIQDQQANGQGGGMDL